MATPAQAHAAWVAAMQQNDRATLLDLAATTELKSYFVNDNLRALQDRVQSGQDGALTGVKVLEPSAEGAGQVGISVWRFAELTSCYRTVLAAEGDGWKVTAWGVLRRCPAGVA